MQENKIPAASPRKIIRYVVAVVASLVLIAGIIVAYNIYGLSSEKIFASHFQPYVVTVKVADSLPIGIIEKTYSEKNYKGVTVLAEKMNPPSAHDNFLTAMSYLELTNNGKAIKHFKRVIATNEENKTKEEAEYYLLLAYIRNKDYDLALELMHAIDDNPLHLYHKKITRKFLREVKMLKWR